MMDLYQEMIIDHSRKPRGMVDSPDGCCSKGKNPLCGDSINLCVELDGDIITKVEYHAIGCSLSIAAASLLNESIVGLTVEQFHKLMDSYLIFLKTGEKQSLPKKLMIFSGVRGFPMRVKCVTFVWHAAKKAIKEALYPIKLSESVTKYWRQIIRDNQSEGIFLRFKQVGCFGWQFEPMLVDKAPDGVVTYQFDDLLVYMTDKESRLAIGTKIDYETNLALGQSKVTYHHPSAKQYCGCGDSFFIEDKE